MCKCVPWFACFLFCDSSDQLISAFVFYNKQGVNFLFFRFLVLQVSQFLRIITFYSTQLPGPNYHCREVRGLLRLAILCQTLLQVGYYALCDYE
jgi:hypothetical protein